MNNDEFIPTRRSLLSRLKNWDDQASWQEFFDTYGKLIHRIAVKAGLSNAEAQDVVQETIIIVARKLPGLNTIRRAGRSRAGSCSSRDGGSKSNSRCVCPLESMLQHVRLRQDIKTR